jgi:predicted Fe-Mo cluster-binding NifX family protein
MKIAFVSDDHSNISAHFGRALYYEIFTLEDGQVTAHETINRAEMIAPRPGMLTVDSGHEQHNHDHNAMIAPIEDCQVLVAGGMGQGAHISLQESDIQPILTDIKDIQLALAAFLAGTIANIPARLH